MNLVKDDTPRGNVTKKCKARLNYPDLSPVCGKEVLPIAQEDVESGQIFTEFYRPFCASHDGKAE